MILRRLMIGLFIATLAVVQAARAENLADTLRDAYHNSGLLDQNRALLRAADEDVAQSLAALRPVISWEARYQYSSANPNGGNLLSNIEATFSINAGLLLYDGGASALATEALKETVLRTRQSLVSIEQDVLFRAVQAYMNVRRNSEFVALRRNNVRLIGQELQAAQDRFDVGEVTRTDVSLAQSRLATARSGLATAEGDLARANEEFVAAVGRRPNALNVVSPAALQFGLGEARNFAVRNHPEILAAQRGVSAAELNIRRAEAALQPRVNLGATLSLDEDYDNTQSFGLTVGGPIYQGGQLQSLIRQAQANRDSARSGLLITVQSIEQRVGNAYASYSVAQASRSASQEAVRAARTAFRGVREEATLGARTTLDVLNAEQDLLDAQANVISAQADEVIASYAILSALGLMTASHLNLGVQEYDPAAYYNLVREAPATVSEQGRALDRVLRAIGNE